MNDGGKDRRSQSDKERQKGKGEGAVVTHEGREGCGWQTAAGGNDQLT